MFNAVPPDITTNAISDTMALKLHMAILKVGSETRGGASINAIQSQRNDLHAESNDQGGRCPRGIAEGL
jgi:hypothetical protein